MSESRKGRIVSEEARKKMSEANKGKPSYLRTLDHRQKMSETIKVWHSRIPLLSDKF